LLEINKIYNQDCLEGMKLMPNKSIDLIVADPPYNIGKDKRWDKWKNKSDYIDFMGKVFTECQRVLKDNGSFYFFHNDFMQIVELQNWLNKNSKFVFKQLITWNKIDPNFKNYGYVQQRLSIDMMRNYYNGFTEYILYYTFQDETGLNTVMLDTNNFSSLRKYFKDLQEYIGLGLKKINEQLGHRKAEHSFYWKTTQWDLGTKEVYQEMVDKLNINKWAGFREYEDLRREYEDLRYKFNTATVKEDLRANSNVWLYPPAPKHGHITPKPVELIENIIKHSSDEYMTIFDPFMGSGTTAIACVNTNRNYIGFEMDETYFNLANIRIENHKNSLNSDIGNI